ncbi:hybrid sensor histidine kinase/response regulator [Sulfitobacter alexandrii]|uniref:histidine kinase n=1 Tax=Sulfitobacter alexandrii TaxID=1917485 RepID=A0A1J0WKD3_9RHOB|nr:PAS-domain containing protein [Sulfitobacter alexandrii]APE44778.1 hybrid sensor histidine kinase/response regulator [Sulfitobacter alexandrii]
MQITNDQTKAMTTAGLNLIAQALTIYDSNLRLAVCNARFQQMFDLPDRLVTPGATFRETIHHLATEGEYGEVADIDAFVQERVEQARAFEPHYMERTRSNGHTISVEGSPLPQGGWVTVYTDITAAKKQETLLRARAGALSNQLLAHAEQLSQTNRERAAMIAALEETKRQLTESEARTRLTTEMMPAHIAHVDAGARYTYSNRRLSSVMPGRPRNIVGLHISEALGPRAFSRIKPALNRALGGEHATVEFTDPESARRIRGSFTPDGQNGAYVMSMDITEETQTREALQQTRKRELAAQMISGLAHDFSNLLTIIMGLQARLARLPGIPADGSTLIDGTLAAARRGGALLSTIADMTGPGTLRPTPVDLDSLIGDLHTLAAPTLPARVRLFITNEAPGITALLDRGRLNDSLLNLILNARDAIGTSGTITLTQRLVHDTWIEWVVTDSGPGFSPSALERGLDPFFTTKGSEGSGLGLPMVYDMTKSAGGDLRLSNAPDGGAQVTLRLPYRLAIPATGGLVLLVEDHDDIRASVRDMLTGLGHSVIEATSADEATALLADLPDIAFVLSDIQLMGEATGLDLARRIDGTTPICLMTSLPGDHEMFTEAQRLAPVLRKPFAEQDLAALIQPALQQGR